MKRAYLNFPVEIRAEKAEGEKKKIRGHAAVFNVLSEDLGGFREKIAPGAFTKTLKENGGIKAFWNHNSDRVLGSTKAGTLELREDDKGLSFTIDAPDWADEHLETLERGDVDQMSFGFRTVKDLWEKNADGKIERTLLEVKLYEISPVAMPAYPQTDAQVRTIEPGRLQELIIQAEHDLIDDAGRAELRSLLSTLSERVEANHSDEPGGEPHHSEEPGDHEDPKKDSENLKTRMRLQASLIGD